MEKSAKSPKQRLLKELQKSQSAKDLRELVRVDSSGTLKKNTGIENDQSQKKTGTLKRSSSQTKLEPMSSAADLSTTGKSESMKKTLKRVNSDPNMKSMAQSMSMEDNSDESVRVAVRVRPFSEVGPKARCRSELFCREIDIMHLSSVKKGRDQSFVFA